MTNFVGLDVSQKKSHRSALLMMRGGEYGEVSARRDRTTLNELSGNRPAGTPGSALRRGR